MRTAISHPHADGIFVIVLVDEAAVLVVKPSEQAPASLVDHPAEITAWAPDLILLALTEPPAPPAPPPAGEQPKEEAATIALLDAAAFHAGRLLPASASAASRSLVLVCSPDSSRIEQLTLDQALPLIAQGLVLQVLGGVAASAARDLDDELALLAELESDEQLGESSDPLA